MYNIKLSELSVDKHKVSVTNTVSILFVIVAGVFVLRASYPGYLNPDSVNQLNQIITGKFNDWQSLFSTLIWAGLDKLIPGPFGFAVFVNVLVWGAIAILINVLSRRFGYWSLLLLLIPFLPGAFNLLGNVHKDIMLVSWLLSASVLGYLANLDALSKRKKGIFRILANLLLIAAFLTRLNAVFAILPLLIYVNHGLGLRRNLLLGIIILMLMPAFNVVLQKLTQADRTYPGNSIKTFHLLGLSYVAGENLFPGKWTDKQSEMIVEACYTPVQWDTAAFWGKCGFIHKELKRQKIWNSDELTYRWIKGIVNNPQGLFTIMSATFYKSIFYPNSRSMFYNPGKSKLFDWEVKLDPPGFTTRLVHNFVASSYNDRLGRPFLFAIVAVLGLGLLVCCRGEINDLELFAIALLSSGLINLLSYFSVTVSAEYRYFYWSCYAIYLGSILCVISFGCRQNKLISYSVSRTMKIAVFALIGIAIGLVAVADELPASGRQVSVTPLDAKNVTIKKIRRASTPNWMAHRIEGVVSSGEWSLDDNGFYHGNSISGVLKTNVPTQGLAIEIEFRSGPDEGRVLVESEQFVKVVDLSSPSAGSHTLHIRPSSAQVIRRQDSLWKAPLLAVLYGFVSFLVLYGVNGKFYKVAKS